MAWLYSAETSNFGPPRRFQQKIIYQVKTSWQYWNIDHQGFCFKTIVQVWVERPLITDEWDLSANRWSEPDEHENSGACRCLKNMSCKIN